jgi:uncharacterized protein YigE (DUF2233 family)
MLICTLAFAVEITTEVHHNAAYTVVRVDPSDDVVLVGQANARLRTLQASLQAHPRAIVAVNSGMYHPGHVPVGLHVEHGQSYAPLEVRPLPGNFGMQPNGVFAVFPEGPMVRKTTEWTADLKPVFATQSGPLLVTDGHLHPLFQGDSVHLRVRNGVGVDPIGRSWWVLSRQPVRFHDLATLFRDVLFCDDALYLDGTVSRMATPAEPTSSQPFGGVWLLGP